MNNIYAQKAKKYKYKYLQLKNEYNAVGGKYLGEGTYGCLISPPFKFTYGLIISGNDNPNMYNNDHVGKLLNCFKTDGYNSFYDEYEELIKLNNIDIEGEHRSKLVFAAYIGAFQNNEVLQKDTNFEIAKKDITYEKLDTCLRRVVNINKEYSTNITNNNRYNGRFFNFGYIISTKVGTSFDKIQLNKFNKEQIIQILTNLKESIKDLITKLYEKNLIHADIKFPNMTLDEKDNFKVCFIDFGLMRDLTVPMDIEKFKGISAYYIYPDILYTYFHIINPNFNITKYKLIELFNYNKNIRFNRKLPGIIDIFIPSLLDKYSFDYTDFFKSLDDYTEYPYQQIYKNYIFPIIKNIDIYGLSLFIYELFNKTTQNNTCFNQNEYIEQKNNIDTILNILLINALYNNIDGPEELIIYLDGIINCLNNNDLGYIKNKIYERRQKKNKPYKMFYKEGYSEAWSKYNEVIIPYSVQSRQQPRQQVIALAPVHAIDFPPMHGYHYQSAPARAPARAPVDARDFPPMHGYHYQSAPARAPARAPAPGYLRW